MYTHTHRVLRRKTFKLKNIKHLMKLKKNTKKKYKGKKNFP